MARGRRGHTIGLSAVLVAAALAACGVADPPRQVTLPTPAGAGSALPNLARGPAGRIVLSWVEPVAGGHALRHSTLSDNGWLAARTVATGNDWFVNWADFPSVVPLAGEFWAAHWLTKRAGGTYSYDVSISLSTDAGASWSTAVAPHSDGTRTEHGFVSLFPWQQGAGAIWLDGRQMATDGGEASHPGGAMSLRYALLDSTGDIVDEGLVDERVCDCCQTDVGIGSAGPLAVYRDRSGDEVRDIRLAGARPAGWDDMGTVHDDGWEIDGCPVNGPAIATDGNTVVVAWFTAAGGMRVRLARSGDGGASFGTPTEIDTQAAAGRVDVELLDDGGAAVSWTRRTGAGAGELCVRRVDADGHAGPVHVVADIAAARASGFPQMVRNESELIFAWTDSEASRLQSARVAVALLGD